MPFVKYLYFQSSKKPSRDSKHYNPAIYALEHSGHLGTGADSGRHTTPIKCFSTIRTPSSAGRVKKL